MENVIQSRLEELDDIELFVKNVENEALVFLQSLGWSSEKLHHESSQVLTICLLYFQIVFCSSPYFFVEKYELIINFSSYCFRFPQNFNVH